jgi:hypothetical protein
MAVREGNIQGVSLRMGAARLYNLAMFSASVWKKYLFRVLKIVTLVFLCHEVLNAKLLGTSSKKL